MRSLETTEAFDLVLAWDSFFHLPIADQRRMLCRFVELTRPTGLLVFNTGTIESEVWSAMHGLDDVDMFHASLDSREYRRQLEEVGFRILQHRIEDPLCGGRTYWIAQLAISP